MSRLPSRTGTKPAFHEDDGYLEMRRTLHPRWYVAGRAGYLSNSAHSGTQLYEGALGFRPNTRQILNIGYEALRAGRSGEIDRPLIVQLVTSVHPVSMAWKDQDGLRPRQ